ncbi:MAG: translation initiation factor IF-2 subunit beta [Candidatus Woesearchaeota archaeon]
MVDDYEALLKKAKETLPEVKQSEERFQIPKVKGHIQGGKTVISNLNQIATTLGRPVKHLIKYLTRELATTAEQVKQLTIFGSKISASKINEKIDAYAQEFVFCKECGKPDTKLDKDGDVYYFKCQACGARYTFTSKI